MTTSIKKKLRNSLQSTRLGADILARRDVIKGGRDYRSKPERRGTMDKAFNQQDGRQAIFKAIIKAFDFEMILETGTFLGLTTEYMHRTSGLNVHTAELNPKNFGFSRERFKAIEGISIYKSDSRSFLKSALANLESVSKPLFIYLDAHWYADLPLLDEVQIIFDMYPKSVILVDDFCVPDDAGYKYDDYGNGDTLHMPYFESVSDLKMQAFFPTLASEAETGRKCGCVVLANDPNLIATLQTLNLLRQCPH